MSDEELQRLGRAVAESGDAASRLAFARALERAGRHDDALAALVPARADPLVRRDLACVPVWDAGRERGARFLDVRPIRRAPRVAWTWKLERAYKGSLQGGPLGIVVDIAGKTRVFDPFTGEVVREARAHGRFEKNPAPALAGTRLLLPRGRTVFLEDLVTGAPEGEIVVPGDAPFDVVARGDRAVISSDGVDVVWELHEGGAKRLWESRPDAGVRDVWLALEDTFGLVRGKRGGPRERFFRVLDARTGELRFEGEGEAIADEAGVVAREEFATRGFDARGDDLWYGERCGELLALAPDFFVVRDDGADGVGAPPEASYDTHDRATGERRATLGRFTEQRWIAVARDVIYLREASNVVDESQAIEALDRKFDDVIIALTPAGEVLWRVHLGEVTDGELLGMVPLHGRLVVLTNHGGVVCFEEGEASA